MLFKLGAKRLTCQHTFRVFDKTVNNRYRTYRGFEMILGIALGKLRDRDRMLLLGWPWKLNRQWMLLWGLVGSRRQWSFCDLCLGWIGHHNQTMVKRNGLSIGIGQLRVFYLRLLVCATRLLLLRWLRRLLLLVGAIGCCWNGCRMLVNAL